MNKIELRSLQAPLKEKYKQSPDSALITLSARGALGKNVSCEVQTAHGVVEAGLHPATGGSGELACAADMLLQALVACAGVTLAAVATALGIEVRGAALRAEGDLDFRGTLGVSKTIPVGFRQLRLTIDLDTNATAAERQKLIELTERYCVVYQTLLHSPEISANIGA